MTPALFVVAAAGGAVGRWAVDRVVCAWQALLVVNAAGSALLGWVVAADVSDATLTVVGGGFCGSLTTFSSFVLEARSLGPRWGALYTAVMIGCCAGAASLASTF